MRILFPIGLRLLPRLLRLDAVGPVWASRSMPADAALLRRAEGFVN